MPNREIRIKFPVGGLDRAWPYREQPPFTTPDALNVRPDGNSEDRTRGGSRPGLGPAFLQQLGFIAGGSPVRSLHSVRCSDTDSSATESSWSDQFDGSDFISSWDQIWSYGTYQYGGGIVTSTSGGALAWMNPGFSFVSSERRELSLYVLPQVLQENLSTTIPGPGCLSAFIGEYDSDYDLDYSQNVPCDIDYAGQSPISVVLNQGENTHQSMYRLFLGSTDNDPANGIEARLTLVGADYYGVLLVNGVHVLTFANGTETSASPGLFRMIQDSGQVTLYWRNNLLGNYAAGNSGEYFGFGMESISQLGGSAVDFIQYEYYESGVVKNRQRSFLLAVSNGNLYKQNGPDSMELVSFPAGVTLPSDYSIEQDTYLEETYFADYCLILEGLDGIVNSGAYDTFTTAAATDFALAGVTTNAMLTILDSGFSQNEQQTVTVTADGGTWQLGFNGQFTNALQFDEPVANVSSEFQSLSTVGGSSNAVVGGVVGAYVITFQGVFAEVDVSLAAVVDINLTNSAGAVSLSVATTQEAKSGTAILGNYKITAIGGVQNDELTIEPEIENLGTVTAISYRIDSAIKKYNVCDDLLDIYVANPGNGGKGAVPPSCPLVTVYQNRIVLAGNPPQEWFMSRSDDPIDWDYSQTDESAAVASSNIVGGKIGDPITALIPNNDDCLFFGAYSSVWILRGNPAQGGSLNPVSKDIGIIGPRAWCRTPDQMIVFLSHDGLWWMPEGCAGRVTSLSHEKIPQELRNLDVRTYTVTLQYDLAERGIHIFITRDAEEFMRHWWFDWEHQSFWPVEYAASGLDPYSAHTFNEHQGGLTRCLIGCRDGYIREHDKNLTTDELADIESYVVFGPFNLSRDGNEANITEWDGVLGEASGVVEGEIIAGQTAERAYKEVADGRRFQTTFNQSGLNFIKRPHIKGHQASIKLSSTTTWMYENMILKLFAPPRGRRIRRA